MHIPKTGGTTFREIFIAKDNWADNCGYKHVNDERRFTIGDVLDRGGCSYFTYEMFDVEECASSSKDNCLVGSHRTLYKCDHYCKVANMYDQYGAKNASNTKIHVMSLFRNPIQHALSAIAHTARHKDRNIKVCASLREYLATEGECITYPIENFQTHVLSHPINLELAMKKLESLFFVGVIELYDASICVLGYQLGQFDVNKCNCSSTHGGAATMANTHDYSQIFPSSMAYVDDISKMMKKLDMDVVLYGRALEITMGRIEYVQRMTRTRIVCSDYESQHMSWARKALKVTPVYI